MRGWMAAALGARAGSCSAHARHRRDPAAGPEQQQPPRQPASRGGAAAPHSAATRQARGRTDEAVLAALAVGECVAHSPPRHG